MDTNYVKKIDAIQGVSLLDYNSVDAYILDLPYPFHARKGGPTARCQNWFPAFDGTFHDGWEEAYNDPTTEQEEKFWAWYRQLMAQVIRTLKKGRYLVYFATEDYMDKIKKQNRQEFPALIYRRAWIWDKVDFTTGYYGRVQHEFLLVFTLGGTKRYVKNHGTMFSHKRIRSDFPTEKPAPLLEEIISLITQEGELVVDPSSGSGSALVGARNLNRQYIGFDIWDKAIDNTKARLKQQVLKC